MPKPSLENFFVLVEVEDGTAIRRLVLGRSTQQLMTSLFEVAADAFLQDREVVSYDGVYRPDSSEVLRIDDFDLPAGVLSAVAEPMSIEPLELKGDDEPTIKAVFAERPGEAGQIVFQSFQASQFLQRRGLNLLFSFDGFDHVERPGFAVREDIHALFDGKDLVFKSDWWARRIFDMSEYYRIATDEELDRFLEVGSLEVHDVEGFKKNADYWVRRKVAAVSTRGTLADYSAKVIRERAAEYDLDLETVRDGDRELLLLPADKQKLKDMLRFLDEDFFKGPITADPYISSSKRQLKD